VNDRVSRLKNKLRVDNYPICVSKSKLITEVYKRMEGEPQVLKNAYAIANCLHNIPIFIEDGELIVGNGASKPMGFEVDYFFGIWPTNEIATLKEKGFIISPEDEADMLQMNEYWRHKNVIYNAGLRYDDDRLLPFKKAGLNIPPWVNREIGASGGDASGGMGLCTQNPLMVINYEPVLKKGLIHIIDQAKQELKEMQILGKDAVQKNDFLNAVIIADQALIDFASRFASLAKELALKESDPIRKHELEQISEICQRVPALPARNFREALQSFWFVFLAINPSATSGMGRFDQYMYPYYKKDIKSGKITDEQVLELLQCLRIKDMQLNIFSGQRTQERRSGFAKWHNMVIGGQTVSGEDATNELSYLALEAAKTCQTPHHTITVRVHEGTPDLLMEKALEVVKTGCGMPAFVGDKSYIEYLLKQGLSLKTARSYALAGCLEAQIPSQSRTVGFSFFNVPLVFDIFFHNGIDPRSGALIGLQTGEVETFATYEQFYDAFKKQLGFFMGELAETINVLISANHEVAVDPLVSSLCINAVKTGKAMLERKLPLENAGSLNTVGMVNVADSLAAVKKLVYEDKKISMMELKAAVNANWQGENYAEIQKLCMSAPKFGNDDDYVDLIADDLYQFWVNTANSLETNLGGKFKASSISISTHWPGGLMVGATPDGRVAGECLADGSLSAMRGKDLKGPTALIKSAAKVKQDGLQSTLLNMKFHPSSLKTTDDIRKLSHLIKTYFEMGGKHVQFNVVGKDTLIEAQKSPESHRDLIVRVAGYSAYFVQLGSIVQNEIMQRIEYEKV
jgi:pyruvate formate-lyase/glycerol dehydratase family glycyl radical enzyme